MRTRKEIDAEYGPVAKVYGDRIFKATVLQKQLKDLENEINACQEKMGQLSQEPAAPEAEEKKTEPSPETETEVAASA